MNKPKPILLTVQSTKALTTNMQRIILQGDGLYQFPADCVGGYIKLLFTAEGSTDFSQLAADTQPVRRTYTIREFDAEKCTITLDFVRHTVEDCGCGHAARWAMSAEAGDQIYISGPGKLQPINTEADWFFLSADMTALPALSVKLASLPDNAKGYAVIEVLALSDIQPLAAPDNVEVIWVEKESDSKVLADKVEQLHWMDGTASVWCACEFDTMRTLRNYFRNVRQVEREHIYISSYWKNGVTEEGHKVIKRQDAETA